MNNPPVLNRTFILVNKQITKVLANIVLDYFKSAKRDWESISITGEYETCLQICKLNLHWSLYEACLRGHEEIVNLLISKGADSWDYGLHATCRGGHLKIAQLMISKNTKNTGDFDFGLYGACRGGHMELVNLMIFKGANNWNVGLYEACSAGHIEIAQLMISRGANCCVSCSKPITDH